jgi:hypothetical protein
MTKLHQIPVTDMPPYLAITPRPDGDDIAVNSQRVMMRHGKAFAGEKPFMFIAEKGIVYAGWVIGIVKN